MSEDYINPESLEEFYIPENILKQLLSLRAPLNQTEVLSCLLLIKTAFRRL